MKYIALFVLHLFCWAICLVGIITIPIARPIALLWHLRWSKAKDAWNRWDNGVLEFVELFGKPLLP